MLAVATIRCSARGCVNACEIDTIEKDGRRVGWAINVGSSKGWRLNPGNGKAFCPKHWGSETESAGVIGSPK